MPATTIDGVVDQLEDAIATCIRTESRLGYFAALYKRMTLAVKAGIARGAFQDAARIEALDVAFANRYLTTRTQYFAGESPGVSWLQAYDAATSDAHIVLQHLLVGINPHIMIDLGVAAARTCPGDQLAGLATDFATINNVIFSLMPVVDRELDALSPETAVIDREFGKIKDALIFDAMEKGRTSAWDFAQSLAYLTPEQQASRIGARDMEARLLGDVILAGNPIIALVRHKESQDVVANIRQLDAPAS
ncbi:MAG: DUF5995 family protein [Vicinamibacterales bacterium]